MTNIYNYDSETPDLKPCPFCGNTPVWHLQGNDHSAKRLAIIKCANCGVEMKVGALRNSTEWLCETIINKWNNRK